MLQQMQNSTIAILLQVKENIMLTTLAKKKNKQQLTLFFGSLFQMIIDWKKSKVKRIMLSSRAKTL